ncbi:MAG: hypothetical protein J5982_02245 [Bacilli bacterium]|nr:hypothetical protein [Bacilli bacterium]
MLGFSLGDFCTQTSQILGFVGWILTIVKISMPLVIIGYGIMDLGKAVVASKDDEIKTATKRLLWRAVAGVAIFLMPSLILWLFGTISDFNEAYNEGFQPCETCLLYPWDCD